MYSFFIVRDKRLKGNFTTVGAAVNATEVDAATSLSNAFTRINTAARVGGKLKTLFVLCHGYGTSWGPNNIVWLGGQGLQLGLEDLKAGNVANWKAIKNSVENIIVYACGAAYSGISSPGTPKVKSDGKGLMSALAKNTNATVYAADQTQWYFPSDFNFGRWEGTIYAFYPGGASVPMPAVPYELTDVN